MKNVKLVKAFKNLIAVDVLSGDCKLVVNGFMAKRVTEWDIVVSMTDWAGESYDRYFNLGTLEEVTLLPEKTKFRCVFANRHLPHTPDVLEIELVKVMNFKGWIFDTEQN